MTDTTVPKAPVDLRSPPSNSPFAAPINAEAQRLAALPPKEVTRIAAEPVKPIAPGSKAWAEMTPSQRYAHQRAATDASTGRGGLHTRAPDGTPLIDGRRADGTIWAADPSAPPDAKSAPTDIGEKIKVGEFETTEAELRDLLAGKAERDLARADIPAQPADYKLELPTESELPEGTAVSLKNDPASAAMIDAAQRWAHKHGLSQAAFNELIAIQAHGVIAGEQHYNQLKAAQLESLGSRGPQRIDGLVTWIRSQVGDADAKPIIATLATAAHVRFFEKVQQAMASQGAAPFTGSHRVAESQTIDQATYDSWSYGEKKAYAERAGTRG
jgi:hypothetical protein